MSLVLQPPWTSQPQVPVGIRHHLDFRGINFATRADVTGKLYTVDAQTEPGIRASPAGIAYHPITSSSQHYITVDAPTAKDSYVFITRISGPLYLDYHGLMAHGTGGSSGVSLSLGADAYNAGGNAAVSVRIAHYGVADYAEIQSSFLPSQQPVNIVVTGRKNGTGKVWMNGTYIGSVALGNLIATSNTTMQIGAVRSTNYFYGDHALSLFAYGDVSDAEAQSFSANPWQIFQPLTRRIFVDVGAGGGTTHTLTASSGSLTLAGASTGLSVARKLLATSNAITLTGNAAGLLRAQTLTTTTGAFSITGTAAGLKVSRKIAASTSAVTLTGTATGLTYTPVGGPTHTLTALPGAFSLTGIGTGLAASRKLLATTNAITLTGSSANLNYSVGLTDSQKIDYIYQALISGSLASDIAAAILAASVETGATVKESLRLSNAVLGGKVSGAGTGTETFRNLADTKDRLVVTVDSSGNRTAITLDLD